MKKSKRKLLALLLVVMCLFALTACGKSDELKGTATIVLAGTTEKTYTIDLEKEGFAEGDNVYQALVWLNENQGLTFDATTSFGNDGFDAFINSIGDLKPAYGTNEYIAVFHNVKSQKDVSAWALPDRKYKETTIYYSGVGVGAIKLADGLVVCISIEKY